MMMRRWCWVVLGVAASACSTHRYLSVPLHQAEKDFKDHIGMVLYDPISRKTIYEHQGDRYFTPASNIKIFTFYSSLQLLGDSIPALRYIQRDDSLIFWGTGDPSFLYENTYKEGRVYNFLKDRPEKLFFSSSSDELVSKLLADTLKKEVNVISRRLPSEAKTFYSVPADSLYKVMMQASDNFIAEQLLMMCASAVSDTLKPEIAIEYVKKKFLFDLPDKPVWVDGSGLSRYNLLTPRSIVRLWEKIYAIVPRERLFFLLSVGGESGTLKNYYKAEKRFIVGKTGTLANNHSLSGFLVTKRGRTFIFSWMNNNFTTPTGEVRARMETVLKNIYEKY